MSLLKEGVWTAFQWRNFFCYWRAVVTDFDLDGNMGIEAVAFFIGQEQPCGIVLLEQQPGFQFNALSIEVNTVGRWIGIEASRSVLKLANLYGDFWKTSLIAVWSIKFM